MAYAKTLLTDFRSEPAPLHRPYEWKYVILMQPYGWKKRIARGTHKSLAVRFAPGDDENVSLMGLTQI